MQLAGGRYVSREMRQLWDGIQPLASRTEGQSCPAFSMSVSVFSVIPAMTFQPAATCSALLPSCERVIVN